ncbi:DUF1499 domain-containing protein [Mesorhizobium sp. L-8-3]|uniref:DUF1499 domain-containing protein n=1 Tax=Mesorhizobium sp. L-8-3 TaxID=2744522 RepID=UPI0019272D7E|nr:DUF1499 domain-containing protein [Mesorhizobium sp. L-8-3]BCH26120.1 hypothetical protein MesoLjLb_59050 [Mesorhizobium sp. L-8-3]
MAVLVERRASSAAAWSRRLAWFDAVLFVVAGLAHRYSLLETVALLWILGIVGALAVAALMLAATGFSRVWALGERGASNAVLGGLIALAVLTPFLVSGYRVFVYPQLNDISTDLSDPPLLAAAAGLQTDTMIPVPTIGADAAAIQQENYPEITGRRYELPIDRVEPIVEGLAAAHGWTEIGRYSSNGPGEFDPGAVTIVFVARTTILGFASDVAIRLADEGGSTYVDMRSASRFGRHDLGDNSRRIAGFLDETDKEVELQAGVAAPETPEN